MFFHQTCTYHLNTFNSFQFAYSWNIETLDNMNYVLKQKIPVNYSLSKHQHALVSIVSHLM